MIHEIKIKAVLNGYIVNVGCQILVFESRQKLIKELDAYLDKPKETEKKYRSTPHAKNVGQGCELGLAPNTLNNNTCTEPRSATCAVAEIRR